MYSYWMLRRKADTHYNYIGKSKQEKNEHQTCMNSFKIVLESNMSPRSHLNLCTVASAQLKIPVFFYNNIDTFKD